MTLNNNHRESLLDNLTETKNRLELLNQCLIKAKNDDAKNRWEIDIFLAEQRIKLIEKSLIENEVDF